MDNKQKEINQVRLLAADPRFVYLKKYMENYLEENFPPHTSIRRSTQFDTTWDAAYAEGGRYHVEALLNNLTNL